MSAGHGYRYLLSSVAVGDGVRQAGLPLTAYYTADGTPPGRWLGAGLAGLEGIEPGDVVEEAQLALLLGEGRHPVTGAALGRAYPNYATRAERVAGRVARLDPHLDAGQRAAAVAAIGAEEAGRSSRRAVAGFDLTFSVPKSVSVLWALAPADVQAQIVAAHHAAIDDVIGLFETEVAATRIGVDAADGAVAQVDVNGVAAVAFDHFDSRAGDPQLHTHVVIANKVQAVIDGRWRALDGRPVHAAMVALSEHYRAVLADHLTRQLGLTWHQRDRGADRNPGWDLTGIPDQLLDAFSTRTTAITAAKDDLISGYVADHGHQPTARTVLKLRQQATLTTRPDKTIHPLAVLMARWQTRASAVLGQPAGVWAARLITQGRRGQQVLTAGSLSDATVAGIAGQVVAVVGERRSTWRRWNLHAEASRQLAGVRFTTTRDRTTTLGRVVAAAECQSVQLTPPDLASVPAELRRTDGTSILRPRHTTVFTSPDLLTAEDRLLELSRTTAGPAVPAQTVSQVMSNGGLGADQAAAVASVATSGRVVDVLIGPAGAGKTTAMRTLRHAWTSLYGQQSAIGLAPSAAAAHVLGEDLGLQADTLAKWLHDHHTGRRALSAGQLVIVDEASLAGTRALHTIAGHAAAVGAKVLLVGDWAQLSAVDAGGALQLLARDRTDIAELTDVRRFHHAWEAAATLQLRDGNPAAIDTYTAHDRLRDGDANAMLEAAYTAWQHDQRTGKTSLLIAPTRDQVQQLNTRAQADRIHAGEVEPTGIRLHDGTTAGIGDVIVTRRNDRRLHGPTGWVSNGDRWTITTTHPDGAFTVQPADLTRACTLDLPAAYAAAHVELGYATTVHRAQGATVDTAHTIITATMTRESMYVAMTRGRQSTTAYVCTDSPDTEAHQDSASPTGRQILTEVLARRGAEPSAHETIAAEQDRYGSIAQLAAEYDTIAAIAQRPRWTRLIHTSGLTPEQAERMTDSDAFGPLCAALRRAEAHHHTPEHLLPRLIAAHPLNDAGEPAAVLQHRLETALRRRPRDRRPQKAPRLIAGLIPHATGAMTDDMRSALDQRQQLIQRRADDLARTALRNGDPWTRHLGSPPTDPLQRQTWLRDLATVAAYRNRYSMTADAPLNRLPAGGVDDAEAHLARTAATRAQRAARLTSLESSRRPSPPSRAPGRGGPGM